MSQGADNPIVSAHDIVPAEEAMLSHVARYQQQLQQPESSQGLRRALL
jgi:hypothetical protein